MKKDSKIYIAGHAGLVGSAILRTLQDNGYTNFVFTPYPEYDLVKQQTVADFFQREKPDYVFVTAAKVGGIVANNTYRGQFIYENLQIQNNIIHSAYKNNVTKLLFLGSSCIYPKNTDQPIKEDSLLTGILEYTNEPYAIAKIAGIKMCESYNIQYGTNFLSVMPTNLYGPNDNYDLEKSHVLPAMIRKFHIGMLLMNNDEQGIRDDIKKLPIKNVNESSSWNEIVSCLAKYGIHKNTNGETSITLWGTGNPMREFLYVDDMAEACVHIMEKVDFKDIQGSGEIRNTHLNIGIGEDLSIKQLALLIKGIVGYTGEINWDNTKPDGTMRKLLDVSKINKTGWKARTKLEEGISKNYAWYLKNRD